MILNPIQMSYFNTGLCIVFRYKLKFRATKEFSLLGLLQGSILPTFLSEAFTFKDSKSTKRHSSHQCLFVLLGSACIKAAHKTLVKLTPEDNFLSFCSSYCLSFQGVFFLQSPCPTVFLKLPLCVYCLSFRPIMSFQCLSLSCGLFLMLYFFFK